MTYDIKRNREHFEVYINGKFYCSADNMREAISEVESYVKGSDLYENKSA